MRVLAFSTYFWPEETGPAPYVTIPLEFLADRGHDVEIWAGFAHYPAWHSAQRRKLADSERRNGLVIHRRWHYIPGAQTAARRGMYESSLFVGALTGVLQGSRPDVVLGVTPTLSGAVAGAIASARFRVPFAMLVHDLMGPAAEQGGVAGGARVASTVGKIELGVARRASRIGIIAEGFRSYFTKAGISDERIIRLRTWTLGKGSVAPREHTRTELTWADDFVVLHAGNMGQKQALENVIDAAALLRDEPALRVVLAGDGNDRSRLRRYARMSGLQNLHFLEPQPWGRYEAMLEAADLLVVNQRASVDDMSLPSKLTSYFAAGRPVVAAVSAESETAREVERSGAGVVVPAEDPAALAAAVRALRAAPDQRTTLSANGTAYAAEYLDAAKMLVEYETFLADLCA